MTDKHRLRVLLGKVSDGTLSNSADDCELINSCFPDDIDIHGMFERAGPTEAFSLIMYGSLDAAVAFVQAALPGCSWFINCAYRGDEPCGAIEGHCVSVEAYSHIPSRALLIAALTALIAVAK